ncbi:hypothetical protein ACE41H_13480 [Paenibacillus enshidis]|uniref:Uncharacterized protein n=1 Tax=Paenibacillus enshidis TaxID=1458439 RepID=A0ABV5AU90_9BACL
MNIFYLILLPFPETRHNTPLADGNVQLVPLHFIQDIIRETKMVADEPSSYWHLLQERPELSKTSHVITWPDKHRDNKSLQTTSM